MQVPGRKFLHVTGVLYIIFGIFNFIAISGINFARPFLTSFFNDSQMQELISQHRPDIDQALLYEAVTALDAVIPHLIILGAFYIFMGVMGIKHRSNYGKAAFLMVLGGVAAGEVILRNFIQGSISFGIIISLIIPACYIFGAYKNKEASAIEQGSSDNNE